MSDRPAVTYRRAAGALLTLSVATLGMGATCARKAPDATACRPLEPSRDTAGVDVAGLEGRYRLTLVATRGPATGRSVTGSLTLAAMPSDLTGVKSPGGGPDRAAAAPFYGSLRIDLGAVGARIAGDLEASDPRAPGVLVLSYPATARTAAGRRVTLRLGSLANDRERTRFDGAYTALAVLSHGDRGFFGSWASGVQGEQAGGHFCALREPA
ncbi:MAG: hypothetical protein ACE5HQ_00120 [Gemmatimonadota bacterium]